MAFRSPWSVARPRVGLLFLGCTLTACVPAPSLPTPAAGEAVAETWWSPEERRLVEVFEDVSRSVVNIQNNARVRRLFSAAEDAVPQGSGSGFVWDKAGHIVTNYHVVQGADSVVVTFADDSSYVVEKKDFVGFHADKDVAVLKVNAPPEKLVPVSLGTSANLKVGMSALAIGNPFGFNQTLTTGVVSALGREILAPNKRRITGVIQTDAAINRGNSGGPLLNSRGQIIGITTAILSPSGTSAGIAFAVPIDVVASIVNDYIQHGKIRRPGLGVMIFEDRVTRMWGFRQGVWLRQVNEGTAAAAAGLRGTEVLRDRQVRREGDLILGIGGQETRNSVELLDALDRFEVGDEVEVLYYRNGKREKTKLKLQQIEVD
jgi:S1-C subfamily serine protease